MIWWILGILATLYVAVMIFLAFACTMSATPQYRNPLWWKLLVWPLYLSEFGPK